MELMQNFGLTFSKYLRENSRQLLIKMLGLLAVLVVLALWIGYEQNTDSWDDDSIYRLYDRSHSVELGFFSVILMFLAMGGASEVMGIMDTKERRISTLMTPSSQLSKFVTAWIINVPVLVGAYVAFAYLADFVRYFVYSSFGVHNNMIAPFSFEANNVPSEVVQVYFMVVIFLQSLFVLGGTIWSGKAYIKTIIVLAAIGMVYSALTSFGFSLMIKDSSFYFRLFDEDTGTTAIWIVDIVVSLGIYVLAYFRFKESEIINRW